MKQKSTMGFRELRDRFFLKAEASRYSESYKRYFRIGFASLEKFVDKNGFAGYSTEVGELFLADYVGSHDVGASSKKLVKTFIAKVNDIYDGYGFCSHHTQAPEPHWLIMPTSARKRGTVNPPLTSKCTAAYRCVYLLSVGDVWSPDS